jgi:hypothetical protein
VKHLLSALALVSVATTASAQVGHLPETSPYRDFEARHEFTFFGGVYNAGRDPIGVAPRDGPLFGLSYQIHVGGPAFLVVKWSHVNTERFAIDPDKGEATRQLGKKNVSVNLFDVDLAVNLTGQKSFHHIIPVINLGAGVATCGCTVAPDPYAFGTPFAFSFGGGLRFVPGGRFQLSLDWTDYMYQLKYPARYFLIPVAGGTPVIAGDQARSFWKNNRALTLGASLLFFR